MFGEVNIPLLSLYVPYKNGKLDKHVSASYVRHLSCFSLSHITVNLISFGLGLTLDKMILSIYLHVLTIYTPNIELITCSLI